MKKRVLSLILAVVMLISTLPATGALAKKGQVFHDVPQTAWYAQWIYPLSDRDIVSGTDSTHFSPNDPLKRSEFLTLLVKTVRPDFDAIKAEYDGLHLCPDADKDGKSQWYSGYVNWAAKEGVINEGESFRPDDKILRHEAVELTYAIHKAHPESVPLTPSETELPNFADQASIPESCLEALNACYLADVINGKENNLFDPLGILARSESSTMVCKMQGISPYDKSQIPAPPVTFEAPKVGSAYGAKYVEFDPQFFTTKVLLANNKLGSAAPASSILKGQNAYIAVNGAVFNHTTNNAIGGSIVRNGKPIRMLLPYGNSKHEASFVIDKNGKASIQSMNIKYVIDRVGQDGNTRTAGDVYLNISPGTTANRTVVTREYKTSVAARFALVVDNNDVITKVYKNAATVTVPTSGYIVYSAKERDKWSDRFYTEAQVGDKLDCKIDYKGSKVQNVQTLLSCGPTVLKNGSIFTNYSSEGSFDSHVLGSGTHMLIGVKKNGKVVIACASGSQRTMGDIMKKLGCTDAINLDGGASTYLNVNGKQLASPGRNLTNMLIFVKK